MLRHSFGDNVHNKRLKPVMTVMVIFSVLPVNTLNKTGIILIALALDWITIIRDLFIVHRIYS